MILHVYRTTGQQTRSMLRAELVAVIHADAYPDDPQALADEHGGDFLEVDHETHQEK